MLFYLVFSNPNTFQGGNKNKTIAIEPHLELLSPKYRGVFNSKKLINTFKEEIRAIKTPNEPFLFDHCIYALQL